MPLMIWRVNLTIRPDRPTSMTYWLIPSGVRERVSPRKIAISFFKLVTCSSGLKLSICVETEKKVLGMIRTSRLFYLRSLKVGCSPDKPG